METLDIRLKGPSRPGQGGGTSASAGVGGVGGVFIAPDPGFVLKTRVPGGAKLFVNVCSHAKIDPPVPMSPEQAAARGFDVSQLGEDDLPMRYPLSSGEPRSAVDKSGAPCTVWDVILNPLALNDAHASLETRWFIAQLVLQNLEARHSVGLDVQALSPGDVKVLKNRKYWDLPVRSQYIENRNPGEVVTSAAAAAEASSGEALLSEASSIRRSSPAAPPPPAAGAGAARSPSLKRARPILDIEYSDGASPVPVAMSVVVNFAAAAVKPRSAADIAIELDQGASSLAITPSDRVGLAPAQLDLPFAVDAARVFATFTKSASELRIRIPVVGKLSSYK